MTNFIDLNDQEDATITKIMEKFQKVEGSGIHEDYKATFSDKRKRQLSFMEQSFDHDRDR